LVVGSTTERPTIEFGRPCLLFSDFSRISKSINHKIFFSKVEMKTLCLLSILCLSSAATADYFGGWLGFGLSENGGMTGADMFIFEAKLPHVVVDAFVTDIRQPQIDDCQDWEFVDSRMDGEFLIVQVQVLPIRDDADYFRPVRHTP